MIPIRLELKNFLPYRSPNPLIFDGIHLACLTGQNGAGKSSLLDAITWGLWGRARGKLDDDLIHLGQGEMSIQLDFEQEGVHYRVYRQRSAGRRGQTRLQLFTIPSDEAPHLINPGGVRETQEKINEILRLDYETFIHSAFLQQGKADAFTVKTPARRKEMLGRILGLDQWQRYEERVKARQRQLNETRALYEGGIQEIDIELRQEPQLHAERKQAQIAYEAAEADLKAAEAHHDELSGVEERLQAALDNQAAHRNNLKQYSDQLADVERSILDNQQKIAECRAITEEADAIEAGYAALRDARQQDAALSEKLRRLDDINARYNQLKADLDRKRADLESQCSGLTSQINELQRQISGEDAGELARVQAEISQLEAVEVQRDDLNAQSKTLRAERDAARKQLDTLKAEGLKLNERLDRLQNDASGTCPLCGQTLDETHREQVLNELTIERDDKRESYRAANQRIGDIESELPQIDTEWKRLGEQLAELPRLRQRVGQLQQQASSAQEARQRMAEAEAERKALLNTLETEAYGQELRTQLATLDGEREAIGYDRATHDSISSQAETFSSYEEKHSHLKTAQQLLPSLQAALDQSNKARERVQANITQAQTALDELADALATLQAQSIDKAQRYQEVLKQRNLFNSANERLIAIEQKFKALADRRTRRDLLSQKLAETNEQLELYKELRYAFGKNGIPTMMMEAAIPELEAAANELLARMTQGRMHLRFDTRGENRDGSERDTLDIEIADELGTRPYELYSGGEAFRIDFAIRVALSKMLARRAGAHLRTLFIDEGFGTQDDDGRNRLVEAITAIQDDFDLILVITHIDDLRDAFPVHVIIEKTTNGSQIEVR